jgi:hypothetical protein
MNLIDRYYRAHPRLPLRVCRVPRTTPSTSAHPRKAPPTNLASSARTSITGPVRQITARGTTNALNVEEITRRRTANNETPSYKTTRFTRVMRQAGQAPEMVQFRNVLEELRNDRLRITNWGFLSSQYPMTSSPPLTVCGSPTIPIAALYTYSQTRQSKELGRSAYFDDVNTIPNTQRHPLAKEEADNGYKNYKCFSSHSPRARWGAAQHAADNGILEYDIQRLGRWSSEAFKGYFHRVPIST